MTMLIKIDNLHKTYKTDSIEFEALRGLDMNVDDGEFVVIAGPSGSGKTTLLNLIGTLDSPTEGSIKIADSNLASMNDNERADLRLENIGFVFQAYNLINVLSAVENVEYVLLLQGVDPRKRRERALKLLEAVGLEGLGDRRPDQLSGGQQQRVAIARALATQPRLVLADEPTANVDQATGKELMQLMLDLNKEHGVTFIISSHDEMVIKRSRRRIRLLDGRIVSDEKAA